jgi:uncharacterized protein YjbI with pentapeptide repeats
VDNQALLLLRNGADAWNFWRKTNPRARPDLAGADITGHLSPFEGLFIPAVIIDDSSRLNLRNYDFNGLNFERSNLSGLDLRGCNLVGASFANACLSSVSLEGLDLRQTVFRQADLQSADLRHVDLRGANLWGANLLGANLAGAKLAQALLDFTIFVEADLSGADLTGASVYGTSAWSLKTDTDTRQSDLVIKSFSETEIIVDSIELAQFVHLLLQDKKFRNLIETLTSKVVLILGRFTPKRKYVLDRVREELRSRGYLPVVFDFERSSMKDLTETIVILAGLSAFVIADITNPRSAPLELQATVPNCMTPFVLLVQGKPFSMSRDLMKYHWVLEPLIYDSVDSLIGVFDESVIEPALTKRKEISIQKSSALKTRHVRDYRGERTV